LVRPHFDADPIAFTQAKKKYVYSTTTGTSSLRYHLHKFHHDEYKRLCNEKGWINQLPGAQRKGAGNPESAPGLQAQSRTPFSQKGFLDHLVNFIVADDQVSALLYSHSYGFTELNSL